MTTISDSGISITTPGEERMFAIEILDSSFRRIERGFGELRCPVAPGLYLVRCDMGGRFAERYAKVKQAHFTDVAFSHEELNLLPSAAPVSGSEACHEYYVYPAIDASAHPHQTLGRGARLVIFGSRLGGIPSSGIGANEPVHLGGIELRDERMKLITAFQGSEILTADDVAVGRVAWSIDMDPGGYLLEWPADDLGPNYRALQPLWLAENWTTLLFANAPRTGGLPDRRSLSIQMCRGRFDPYNDPTMTAAELALASLRSNRRQLADQHLNRLLHDKFENPMLGLLGSHMLLERTQPNQELLTEIIGNLRVLLGAHPDITALALIAHQRFGIEVEGIDEAPQFPPMFRAGLAAMINAEWEQNQPMRIGPLDSLARFHLSPDEPWTFFWRSGRMTDMTDFYSLQPFAKAVTRLPRSWGDFVTNAWKAIAPFKDTAADYLSSLLEISKDSNVGALAEDESTFVNRLRTFARQLLEQKGPKALRQLKPEHLRWTGLSPEQAEAVIQELQSWNVKLFVKEENKREEQYELHS